MGSAAVRQSNPEIGARSDPRFPKWLMGSWRELWSPLLELSTTGEEGAMKMKNLYHMILSASQEAESSIDVQNILESIYRDEREYNLKIYQEGSNECYYPFGFLKGIFVNGDLRVNDKFMNDVWTLI